MSRAECEAAVIEYLDGVGRADCAGRAIEALVGADHAPDAWVMELQQLELEGILIDFLDACKASGPSTDSASPRAARIAGLLGGGGKERAEAFEALTQVAESLPFAPSTGGAAELTDVAARAVAPLCDVLCRPVADVDAKEFRRAAQVLAELHTMVPGRVCGELAKAEQSNCCSVWMARGTALSDVLADHPPELCEEGGLTGVCPTCFLVTAPFPLPSGSEARDTDEGSDTSDEEELEVQAV